MCGKEMLGFLLEGKETLKVGEKTTGVEVVDHPVFPLTQGSWVLIPLLGSIADPELLIPLFPGRNTH